LEDFLNKLFFLSLLDLTAAHAKQNRQIFSDLGLTDAQPKILYILIRGEGWLQKDLAEFCKISPASMTTLLNNMENSSPKLISIMSSFLSTDDSPE